MKMAPQTHGVVEAAEASPARRIVIAAGGTGGHFFPAEALASELLARGHAIALLTDRRSKGEASAVFAGHPVQVLSGAGIAGRGFGRAVKAVAGLAAGSLQARRALLRLRPAAVVGFGGYPSIPPAVGARLLFREIPLVLHEQNAVLGRANRALAWLGAELALSFSDTRGLPSGARMVVTGNPVRGAIAAHAGAVYSPPGEGKIRLLVLGGSLGARVLSEVVPDALARLPAPMRRRLVVTQQCRAEDIAGVRAAYQAAGIMAELAEFFADVATLLVEAHLVIARAGASTVAEIALVGRPAILVPLPGAIDDHQAANAAALTPGAWTMRQDVFTAPALAALLTRLFDDDAALERSAQRIARFGRAGAAGALADLVEQRMAAVVRR
jgi:UDP-N-acetylglucosamine--N-acetylmuramyl-(pentapeptide) pyrophosphoryl-undecaprenol N-acetylglucosamine transferase